MASPDSPAVPPLLRLVPLRGPAGEKLIELAGRPKQCFGCRRLWPSQGRTPPGWGPNGAWGGSRWGWEDGSATWGKWWCYLCWRRWWWSAGYDHRRPNWHYHKDSPAWPCVCSFPDYYSYYPNYYNH